ncbi:cupin domain-containing protein [Ideonella sp. A 288]|uniref:cupin domain-containing protein n=1 Tax=Ideonella sp. A 288 TaxID=1962181 RepID=UPI000B4BCC50|nr:cupin domain-containing protein [Ideonella sp. A 288]
MRTRMPDSAVEDSFEFTMAIAPELKPMSFVAGREEQLRRSVLDRVRQSADVHRHFTTIRREDATWAETSPGVRHFTLNAKGGLRIDLLEVAPSAAVPWQFDAQAQEVLVVGGTLALGARLAPTIQLSPLNHVVLEQSGGWGMTAGRTGASLYMRSRVVDLARLPEGEAQWWRAAQGASLSAAGIDCPWSSYLEGVDAAVLHAQGDVASMLVRIAPGAAVPDHGHDLDEDCFMLEGEMFLGDILMRGGDYQLAPQGCRHVGIASDFGGLFYFHGAIPPSASEQAP